MGRVTNNCERCLHFWPKDDKRHGTCSLIAQTLLNKGVADPESKAVVGRLGSCHYYSGIMR